MKKENGKKVISMFLILTMILGLTDFMSSEKKVSADSSVLTVGDSVYFGSYYQDKVTDKKLIEYIDEQNKDGGNKIDIDGIDFIKTRGNWFSEEQIEWQILADEGNNYLLLEQTTWNMHQKKYYFLNHILRVQQLICPGKNQISEKY